MFRASALQRLSAHRDKLRNPAVRRFCRRWNAEIVHCPAGSEQFAHPPGLVSSARPCLMRRIRIPKFRRYRSMPTFDVALEFIQLLFKGAFLVFKSCREDRPNRLVKCPKLIERHGLEIGITFHRGPSWGATDRDYSL
jgi:hypothetical protein